MPCKLNLAAAALVALSAGSLVCERASADDVRMGVEFRAGTYADKKSPPDCARDGMAALKEAGFTKNLAIIPGSAPAWGAGGLTDDIRNAGLIVCGKNHDFVVTVTSTSLEEHSAERAITPLLEVFLRIANGR